MIYKCPSCESYGSIGKCDRFIGPLIKINGKMRRKGCPGTVIATPEKCLHRPDDSCDGDCMVQDLTEAQTPDLASAKTAAEYLAEYRSDPDNEREFQAALKRALEEAHREIKRLAKIVSKIESELCGARVYPSCVCCDETRRILGLPVWESTT